VEEANKLFGAHHYRDYHFLLTLSDHVAHFGLEHHESSDDRVDEQALSIPAPEARCRPAAARVRAFWNGKFRRPAGLATPTTTNP